MVWRLVQKKDQRSSPLSILIIMLAIPDFLYCVHLILLETLVSEFQQDQTERSYLCITSAYLSWFSCSTAQWATFNIALYSCQALSDPKWWPLCFSLVRRRGLIFAITFQYVAVVGMIVMGLATFEHSFESVWFSLPLQDTSLYDNIANSTFYRSTSYVHSNSELIAEIFGRCAWTQSNGFNFCRNFTYSETHGNHTTTYKSSTCGLSFAISGVNVGLFVASMNTILTLACGFHYSLLSLLLLRAGSQTNATQRSDIDKLRWSLRLIVFLNNLCWIPTTVLHWITAFGNFKHISDSWLNKSTVTSVLLISIGPAANPFIYTLTGKNFLRSIRKFCRRMKCEISVRRNSSNCHDDHTRGVERCSCIPCVKCVHLFRDFETEYWNTDETKLLSSTDETCL